MGYLYGLYARGVPELNEELQRARQDPRYGFRTLKDRDYPLQLSTAAARWAHVPLIVGLAFIASGVVLLLI